MSNGLIRFAFMIILAAPAWSQDEAPAEDAAADSTEAAVDEETVAVEDEDDTDLDEQVYEEDEDDFVPTEEIPADEPIPFPSNI